MIEINGNYTTSDSGNKYHELSIFEVPKEMDGSGIRYSIDGSKFKYWWVNIRNSVKVDMSKVPDGFEFSFKHGLSNISSIGINKDVHEIIRHSDWESNIVTKEDVEYCERARGLKLRTKKDVRDNVNFLINLKFLPSVVISDILSIYEIEEYPPYNGEIGLSEMIDLRNVNHIIRGILSSRQL